MIVIARSEATWQSPDKSAYYRGIASLLFAMAAMRHFDINDAVRFAHQHPTHSSNLNAMGLGEI